MSIHISRGERDTKSFIIKFFLHCLRKTTAMLKISIIFPQLLAMMCGWVGWRYDEKIFDVQTSINIHLKTSSFDVIACVCVNYDNCSMCGAAVNGNMIVRFNFALALRQSWEKLLIRSRFSLFLWHLDNLRDARQPSNLSPNDLFLFHRG